MILSELREAPAEGSVDDPDEVIQEESQDSTQGMEEANSSEKYHGDSEANVKTSKAHESVEAHQEETGSLASSAQL